MTCIVGLEDETGLIIGCDSAAVGSEDLSVVCVKRPKIFAVGELLIGFTGSFRFSQLLEFHLNLPSRLEREEDVDYMMSVSESIRMLLIEANCAEVVSNVAEGGTALLGYRGRLYTLHGDFSILQFSRGFDAIGCGGNFALGALMAIRCKNTEHRVRKALEISAELSAGVKAPFYLFKQDRE